MRSVQLGLSIAGAFALGCAAASVIPDARAEATQVPTRYEYYVASVEDAVTSKRFGQKNKAFLDAAGREGWELVTVDVDNYYFKRPVR